MSAHNLDRRNAYMTTELRGTTPVSPSNQELAREFGISSSLAEGAPGLRERFQAVLERQGSSLEEETPAATPGNVLPQDPRIRTVVLGPRIKIKTVADVAPDTDALLAFARMQGMSDAAIALIAQASQMSRNSSAATPLDQGGTDTLPAGVAAPPADAESGVIAFPERPNSLQVSSASLVSLVAGDLTPTADARAGTLPGSLSTIGALAGWAAEDAAGASVPGIITTPLPAGAPSRSPEDGLRVAEDGARAIVTADATMGSTLRLAPGHSHPPPPFNPGVRRDGSASFHGTGTPSSAASDTPAPGIPALTPRLTPGDGNRLITFAGAQATDHAGRIESNPVVLKQEMPPPGQSGNSAREMLTTASIREARAMGSKGSPGLPAADANATALVTGFAATLAHRAALADAAGTSSPDRFGPPDDPLEASGLRSLLDDVAGSEDARPSSAGPAWPSSPESPESKSAGATRVPDTSSQDVPRTLDSYRQLSLKMAEAVGQRILGMLNRGEWQLALQLNPAHLGRVDIRLTMRGNRMVDAEFMSSRSDTVSLLASGESQLRACLDQAGFNTGQISSSFDSNLDTASRQARRGSQPSGNAGGSPVAVPSASNAPIQPEHRPPSILTLERLDVFV